MTTTYANNTTSEMRLYSRDNSRLYINASERERFLRAATQQSLHIHAFCLSLLYTGCRLSEARALTPSAIQSSERIISVRSLKKRKAHHIREIPVPQLLIDALTSLTAPESQNTPLWPINRITAYRWIKTVMRDANITGPQACPKGLRHGYGIHAVRSGVQLNMLQKWMGHASIKTTAIYTNAVGKEEQEIAEKMW